MVRRIHVRLLHPGKNLLDVEQAHHVLDVLRLTAGTTVEVFDDAGHVAAGILQIDGQHTIVEVETLREEIADPLQLTIAAAIPKGDRADWMIEKLSELGVHRFIPLIAERSVVIPAGKNKSDRWNRIAIESAKQSRRNGVMAIADVSHLADVMSETIRSTSQAVGYLSTQSASTPLMSMLSNLNNEKHMTLLIGPEGGWTDAEMKSFEVANIIGLTLGKTVLRVETAAIAAAAILSVLNTKNQPRMDTKAHE